MFNHRLLSPLRESMKKGNNLFFTYGISHKDYFLYNFYEGILPSNETYKKFFLSEEQYKTFIHIINNKIYCYEYNSNKYCDITDKYFTVEQPDDIFDSDNDTVESKEAQELEREHENYNTKFTNDFNRLKNIIEDKRENVAIFFEDFDWSIGLYSSNQDDSIEFIKRVKDLSLLSKVKIIISLDDIEMIKKYNFNTEGGHCIYVGNPSAKEIKLSFLRIYMNNISDDIEIQDNIFEELDYIAYAISSSNKDLRASMRIFDQIVEKDNKIDKRDFEIAIDKIIDEKVTFDDIVLNENTKSEVITAVDKFLESEDNKDFRKGFIFTGPPGTGKTFLVKALANEKNCFFMAPTLSDLKGEYVGQSSAKVRKIFEQARANQPTIIFIDEADTIFPDRNLAGSASDSFGLDMVNQFLVEIDGMTTGKQKIFVIAATNRPEVLDSAVKSRLSSIINIGLPDKLERIQLFDKKLQKHGFIFKDKFYADEIVTKTENMSGRDIDNFVKKLSEVVIEKNIIKISNLSDNEESKLIFLEVLEEIESMTIEELRRKSSVEIKKPEELVTKYKNIIGYESIKNKIQRQTNNIIAEAEKKIESKIYNITTKRGVLLYGPPGNAKTKFAEAVAKENNLYLFKVISKDFISGNCEEQLRNLELIFQSAIRLSKMCTSCKGVLLFFDEFDSLASNVVLNQVIRGTLLDFLSNSNGIRADDSKVMFIAATNFYDILDEALIRKGRIDEHIFMDNPSRNEGVEIINSVLNNDKNVKKLERNEIENIYDLMTKRLRDKARKAEEGKLELQSLYNFDVEKTRELIEKQLRNVRPSGAEIVDLCSELKQEAFYSNNINKQIKKIIISEEIVKIVIGEINDR